MKVRITKLPQAQSGLEVKMKDQRSGLGLNSNMTPWGAVVGKMSEPSVQVNSTLQPVPYWLANVEAEKGEVAMLPDKSGIPNTFKIGGNKHYNGGTPLNIPNDSFIFSDTPGMKIKDPAILKMFGTSSKSATPADLAKKYDINQFKKVLADPTTDKLQKETAEVMIANYNMKLAKLGLLQESKKGFPQGLPKIAMPYIESLNIDPSQFAAMNPQGQPQNTSDNEYAKYGMFMQKGGIQTLGDTIKNYRNDPNRYIVPFKANMEDLTVGVRNRNDNRDLNTEGAIFSTYEAFNTPDKVVDRHFDKWLRIKNGKIDVLSSKDEADPSDIITGTYGHKVKSINRNIKYYVKGFNNTLGYNTPDNKQGNIKVFGDNGTNTLGGYQGGKLILTTPDHQNPKIVYGSPDIIEKEIENYKKEHNIPWVWALDSDGKAFEQTYQTLNKKITGKELNANDNTNSKGGNFIYLKPNGEVTHKTPEKPALIPPGTITGPSNMIDHNIYNVKSKDPVNTNSEDPNSFSNHLGEMWNSLKTEGLGNTAQQIWNGLTTPNDVTPVQVTHSENEVPSAYLPNFPENKEKTKLPYPFKHQKDYLPLLPTQPADEVPWQSHGIIGYDKPLSKVPPTPGFGRGSGGYDNVKLISNNESKFAAKYPKYYQAYREALNSGDPSKMKQMANVLNNYDVPNSLGWIHDSDQDVFQNLASILKEHADKKPVSNIKDPNENGSKITEMFADYYKQSKSETDPIKKVILEGKMNEISDYLPSYRKQVQQSYVKYNNDTENKSYPLYSKSELNDINELYSKYKSENLSQPASVKPVTNSNKPVKTSTPKSKTSKPIVDKDGYEWVTKN